MAIPGTVTLTGIIAPTSTGDTYPITDPKYGIDGLRNVSSISERNNIPNDRRKQGMIVGVDSTGSTKTEYWTLLPSPWTGTDSDWVQFQSGTNSGSTSYWSASTGTNAIVVVNSDSVASGTLALAEGSKTVASGVASHAEGAETTAIGEASHAEGNTTTAWGSLSHAEGQGVLAFGDVSHAEGDGTVAFGWYSHSEGKKTTASGISSHAEGESTIAGGDNSHAEGYNSTALGFGSHAEGGYFDGFFTYRDGGKAIGPASHAEGGGTKAFGEYSHAEGGFTIASGNASHAEGYLTTAQSDYFKYINFGEVGHHAEGLETTAIGGASHSEGVTTRAIGRASHAEGSASVSIGDYSHAEGSNARAGLLGFEVASITGGAITINTTDNLTSDILPFGNLLIVQFDSITSSYYPTIKSISGVTTGVTTFTIQLNDTSVNNGFYVTHTLVPLPKYGKKYSLLVGDVSHAEGNQTTAIGNASHAEGENTTAFGSLSHAEGSSATAIGFASHAEGDGTIARGGSSHSEGAGTKAYGSASHAEGQETTASGDSSHAEGNATTAIGLSSHAEGLLTKAIGDGSHAEGGGTIASGNTSHAEGTDTQALGDYSHTEGKETIAIGESSHAGGFNTTAQGNYSFVHGQNSVAIGTSTVVFGSNITGNTNDTLYVNNISILSGATNGYVLTSDASGNGSWKPSGGVLTGGTYSNGVYSFTNNSGNQFGVTATTTYAAGAISGSTGWTSTGTGQMNLPAVKVALFNNPNNIEPVLVYDIASGTTGSIIPALTDNTTNYVVIEYNNGLPRYNVSTADITNDSDIVLAYIVYRLGNFIHVLEFGNYGAGLPNKLSDRIVMTNRFGWESGLSLGLSGSTGVVTLTSGVAWNGSYRQNLDAVNSQDDVFFQNYHVGGSWTAVTTADTFNNVFYDNGTNIVSGDTGKFLVNYYYRGQERNDHLYEVFGTSQYASVTEAEATTSPLLPELVSSHAFLVGRIIVKVGETTGITQTAFATVFQPSGFADASGLHNSLQGLQGGTAGQYYHLTQAQYNSLSSKYSTNVLFSSSVQQTITHGLNTQDVLIQLWDSTNKLVNGADIIANTVNTVQITVATGGNYRVVIIG